jgi:glycosyltransferase involved in cell wall biosynthesis
MEAIDFCGRKRAAELSPYYRAAQVLVVPSAYEGLPMVILEAFAQGLPCVATRVSGHPEVIADGENGFLVPLDDPQAMAAAVIRILQEPGLATRMGESARATVRAHFDVRRQVREYLALYDEMVGRAGAMGAHTARNT